MDLEDLPILRAGTTLKFEEYKDRIAEVRYQWIDSATTIHLVGYVPGIFPKENYMDRTGKIFYRKNSSYKRRLLLIREISFRDEKESIWNDDLRVEIPLQNIREYKELTKKYTKRH